MDGLIVAVDRALRTVFGVSSASRPVAWDESDPELDSRDRADVAALMRVNHCGEVCAQALYLGQAMFARNPEVTTALQGSAAEEIEHLAWTARRIGELGGRTSVFNPVWFAGSLSIGAAVAILGDRYSLAFLRETEIQVVEHLRSHLVRVPPEDQKTRAILSQMIEDEARHAALAEEMGGDRVPLVLRGLMRLCAASMTRTAYYL